MAMAGIVVRWIQFAAATLLVGVLAFSTLIARPAVPAARLPPPAGVDPLACRFRRLAAWAVGLALACGVLDLLRQTAVATGLDLRGSLAPGPLGSVLLGTRYGTVWLVRHGLLAVVGAFVLAGVPAVACARPALDLAALAFAAASLAIVGAAGHAASAPSAPAVAMTVDALHLVTTGVWAGGLLPLALLLRRARDLETPAGTRLAAIATRRFSAAGAIAIAVLGLSGVYNAAVQVGGVPGLAGTPYGRWLSLKIALLVPLLAIAGVNRLRLKPRLLRAAREDLGPDARLLDRLRAQVLIEATLAAAILGVVAILGLTTPARHAVVIWPFPFRLSWEATRGLPGVEARVAAGSMTALLGLVAAVLALIVRPPRAGFVVGAGGAALAIGAAVALPALAIDAYPTTYLRPAVPYATGSIAQGLDLYRAHCMVCHGPSGHGDGPAARSLRPPPADLTGQHTAHYTAGEMFWWVTHGIRGSAMPAFEAKLSTDARWDLVNGLRALASAARAHELGSDIQPRPWLVAPDFGYTMRTGESGSLRDHRGRRAVLLVLFTLPGSDARLVQLGAAYPALVAAGAEVLGIPQDDAARATRTLAGRGIGFPIAVDGAPEAATTYALFRPVLDAPPPSHLELLVDRQGYVRARWAPGDSGGWQDPARLLEDIEKLRRERSHSPAPDDHVH